MPSARKPYRLADHQAEFMAFLQRKGIEAPPEIVARCLAAIDEFKHNNRVEAATLAIRERRLRRLKHTRHPGYGFKWAGRKRVPDEAEQRVMSALVRWWCAGSSWHEIATHLLRNRITTAAGAEWSVARVRRAYRAAINGAITLERPGQHVAG